MVNDSVKVAASLAVSAALLALLYRHAQGIGSSTSQDFLPVDIVLEAPQEAVRRFSEVLKYNTVSSGTADNHVLVPSEFKALHKYLRKEWPLVWKRLKVQEVNSLSLLFTWPGSNPGLKPVLCVSHLDVVAIASEELWTHPPFSGAVADGFVWGRGAMDVKVSATALLESVSQLLKDGFVPERTLYLAFGHDEEVGGKLGAGAIARQLQEAGVQLEMLLDEGGVVLEDGIGGFTSTPVALIATAEKGFQTLDVEVRAKGGHSSMPPRDAVTASSRLARIVSAIDRHLPKTVLQAPITTLLTTVGAHADSKLAKFLLPNCERWPMSAVMTWLMSRSGGELAAGVRTTVALTNIETYPPGDNVMPSLARATFNFRLLPGEQLDFPEKYLQKLSAPEGKGADIKVVARRRDPPSDVTSVDSLAYQLVRRAALETLKGPKGVIVAPNLLMGATDSSNYVNITAANVVRFAPFVANRTAGDLQRVHGIDERQSIESYLAGIKFYIRFLQLALRGTDAALEV